jgi:hypothetical protein
MCALRPRTAAALAYSVGPETKGVAAMIEVLVWPGLAYDAPVLMPYFLSDTMTMVLAGRFPLFLGNISEATLRKRASR